MRILKDKTIQCSVQQMVQILELCDNSVGQGKFNHWLRTETWKYPVSDLYTFKSGAQLGRKGKSAWYVYGYTGSGMDGHSAFAELKAADHMRQAISLKKTVEYFTRTPGPERITYQGLWGFYPDGTKSC